MVADSPARALHVFHVHVAPRATSDAKEWLASAWVTRGALERDEDINPCDAFEKIARAVEVELRDELLGSFERLVHTREQTKLIEAIACARGTDWNRKLSAWTLGSMVRLIRNCATHHRGPLEQLELMPLVKLSMNLKWLDEVLALRNAVTHAEKDASAGFDVKGAAKKVMHAFFERRGEDLGPILDARDAVQRVARG